MPTVFITGANRGIGLEFARQYGTDGWTVIATCRNPITPGQLATIPGDIQVHGLDVNVHEQVNRLGQDLDDTAIDVLINNAGIFGPRGMSAENMDYIKWEQVLRTNTLSPLKVATTFAKNLAAGQQKKLVTISSMMGSITQGNRGSDYIYRSSKAAVNMVMRNFSADAPGQNLIVANFHPGWVQTDMGGSGAAITPTESVIGLRKCIAGLTKEDTGKYFNYDGNPIAW